MEVLSLPSARLEFSFTLGIVIPLLYTWLLLKNILGQPKFQPAAKPSWEEDGGSEELATTRLHCSGSFRELLS